MGLTYQRLRQLRRWALVSPTTCPLLERAWDLARAAPPGRLPGPVGIALKEVRDLGWSWESGPWQWDRPGDSPLPVTGGPQGFFDHEVRVAVLLAARGAVLAVAADQAEEGHG